MLPAIVMLKAQVDLHEGPPFGPLGFADQVQARYLRRAIGLARIAIDARADDVFPRGRPAPVARDHVIQIEVFAIVFLAAVLAGVAVALEDVVAGELHFLLGHAVKEHEQDYARNADAKGDGADALRMGVLAGEVMPLVEIEGLERAVAAAPDHLRPAVEQKRERPSGRADVHRLP